jgi:hypothetical protein
LTPSPMRMWQKPISFRNSSLSHSIMSALRATCKHTHNGAIQSMAALLHPKFHFPPQLLWSLFSQYTKSMRASCSFHTRQQIHPTTSVSWATCKCECKLVWCRYEVVYMRWHLEGLRKLEEGLVCMQLPCQHITSRHGPQTLDPTLKTVVMMSTAL